ncbi:hypothetical protein D3C80_1899380 [compost metagenome]
MNDLEALPDGVTVWAENQSSPEVFDLAVIATGHVWPEDDTSTRAFFPSPWSGLMAADIRACNVGILGTSLSGLDAAMAVVIQHGTFTETDNHCVTFRLDEGSESLNIVLASR